MHTVVGKWSIDHRATFLQRRSSELMDNEELQVLLCVGNALE